MAHDPRSQAVEQSFPAEFTALSTELWGCAPADLDDQTYRQLANEVAVTNANVIIRGARVLAGDSIELPSDLATRLAAAGASDRELREFARAARPDEDEATALRKFQMDIARSRGAELPKEAPESRFDRAF